MRCLPFPLPPPPSGYSDNLAYYAENDIYYLEVCVLNEVCANNLEIFTAEVGDHFHCQFDEARWGAFKSDMLALG